MLKLAIISAIIAGAHLESIYKFEGAWTALVTSPDKTIPVCDTYSFAKVPGNNQCTCADGKSSSYIKMLSFNNPQEVFFPLSIADRPNQVKSLLNVACTCAGMELKRFVARYINSNYMTMYYISTEIHYTQKDPNYLALYGKMVPKEATLRADLERIDELKNRTIGDLCSQDVNEIFDD